MRSYWPWRYAEHIFSSPFEIGGLLDNLLDDKQAIPVPCAIGEHIPVILHRTGGLSAELHNTCGKCGRMILNLAGTWIIDVCREQTSHSTDQESTNTSS